MRVSWGLGPLRLRVGPGVGILRLRADMPFVGDDCPQYGAGLWRVVWMALRYLSLAAIPRRMHRISSDLRS